MGGLVSESDYILSSTSKVFDSSETFFQIIAGARLSTVELIVFNLDQDKMRMVKVVPKEGWGGSGLYVFMNLISKDWDAESDTVSHIAFRLEMW